MFGQGPRAIAVLTAILVALQLSACGGDSSATEIAEIESVEKDLRENGVNEDLRPDILSFGKVGSEAELEGATAVARAYLNARASKRYSDACAYMSKYMLAVAKGAARQADETGCAAGVERLSRVSSRDDSRGPPRIDPSSIRRANQRTFVIYEGDDGGTYAMLMQRKGGTWKIQGFEPTRIR